MNKAISLFVIASVALISCRNPAPSAARVVVIQPLGDIPASYADCVHRQLKLLIPHSFARPSSAVPAAAWYAARSRYRADSILNYLESRAEKDTVIIAITDQDISASKDSVRDWGIMGLAHCPGNVCVVSIFRLSKTNRQAQLYKLALHELGHTEGLPHCRNSNCFMQDAEGGNPLEKETGFCKTCKAFLKNKGWNLL